MCTNVTYTHRCNDWRVVFTDKRQKCPHCHTTCGALVEAGAAVPVREPSPGVGGLTGRPACAD